MHRNRFRHALDAIRRAALDPRAWQDVQATTEVLFGATASQLAEVDHLNGNAFFSRTSVMPEIDLDVAPLAAASEPVRWSAENPRWRRFVDYDFTDESRMARSALYAHNARYDIRYRMGLRLLDTPGRSVAIVWLWPASFGHVQARELRILDALAPCLRISAEISDALSDRQSEGAFDIDAVARPAFLVTGAGRLFRANAEGQALLLARTCLCLDGGQLEPAWRRGRGAIARLLGMALSQGDPGRPLPHHLVLPARGLPQRLVVSAMPLARRRHFLRGAEDLSLLLVGPGSRARGSRAPRLRALG